MKDTRLTMSSVHFDADTERIIQKKDAELKALADKNAKLFALRNLPAPTGDSIAPYTGEIKTGYEKLAADIAHHLQPHAHIPEAKIEADFYKEKDAGLTASIDSLSHQNEVDGYELARFNPGTMNTRICWAVIASFIITLGEILYNTKSFQVVGENMLFALVLSISASFAVFIFSHMVPLLYKAAKTKGQRIGILVGAFLLITGVFTALAILRSTYLASNNVQVRPIYFVLINLFFFVVSSVLSFFVLPTWAELKENAHHLKLYRAIGKRKQKIENLKKEKLAIQKTVMENTKHRIRVLHLANYSADRFRRMYREAVELFKRTNLTYRTDGKMPDCFSQPIPEPDIEDIVFTSPSNRKIS